MGKNRKTNKHLPPRVYIKNGAYYYVDRKNKWDFLARTFTEAMAVWAKTFGEAKKITTMADLIEVAPLKSETTFRNNVSQTKPLRLVFGDMEPSAITPVHIYAYMDKRAQVAKVAGNREKSLLSHIFTMAIR